MSAIISFFRRRLEQLAESRGYRMFFVRIPQAPRHQIVVPKATFAPWTFDEEFRKVYERIRHVTLVDEYRCYELWQLVQQVRDIPGCLLEVGVWRGGTAAIIASSAQRETHETVYACDTFAGVVKAGNRDATYKGGEHANVLLDDVRSLFVSLGLNNIKCLQGTFPEGTASLIAEDRVRFCHIDVDVYDSAKDTMDWVWPRLSQGGIVVFDDYGFSTTNGVTEYVNEERKKTDRVTIHNLNGHAIMIKIR